MAMDAFLKIEGIPGESNNIKHRGEIEVLAFSWNIANKAQVGGGGAGRAQASDFMIVKHIDIATPSLFAAVCTGEHFKEALFTVEETGGGGATGRKAGGKPVEFLKIKLTDILISSFQTGGGSGDQPTEQVSINFVKIEIDRGGVKGESCDFREGDIG